MTAGIVRATAGMPLPVLLDKLARRGWPGLDRRHGNVLRALCAVLPHRSAEGKATAYQLADAAGYSSRWTRDTLAELEALGVITWHRGGVRQGKPLPSLFRVVKRRLVELLADGAQAYVEAVAQRNAATRARIAGLAACFPHPSKAHRPRSDHAEVAASPTLRREVTGGAAEPGEPLPMGTGAPPAGLTADLRRRLRRR